MKIILILPFLIELFGDAWLIKRGRKDISSLVRALMIIVIAFGYNDWHGYTKALIIALMPYCFFDPALNLLRKKGLCYNGKTKAYDKFLSEFPCWFLFIARVTALGVLFIIYKAL